ncbi:MAG: flavodoxin family protein [Desulfovibrionaceae bacterium]|nr:flavodoxin family protein [Desulfovibrionaceae bacterium]
MRILAVNSSARAEKSCTQRLLDPLLEGMRQAGARTETVFLGRLDIGHCLGCFKCWTRTPGVCVQKDDMAGVLDKFVQADIVILGTPLYHYTMSGLMKNFIDRTLPTAKCWIMESQARPGLSTHPLRFKKPRAMFLVSPCGFPEFEHFEQLVAFFRFYARQIGWDYLGELLRPCGDMLRIVELQDMLKPYFDLVRRAGRQLIEDSEISADLKKRLRADLAPGGPAAFRKRANQHWATELKRWGHDPTPPAGAET